MKRKIQPLRDAAKKTIFLAKTINECICAYPEHRTNYTNIGFGIVLLFSLIFITGQGAFLIENINDFAQVVSCVIILSPAVQGTVKIVVLVTNSKRLEAILNVIWFEFWPADVMGSQTNQMINFRSKCFGVYNIIMFSSGFFCVVFIVNSVLIGGDRTVLPCPSLYPFDWSSSPVYEIVCILQWIHVDFIVLFSICGHDFLFMGITHNIRAQFDLLQQAFRNFGTKNVVGVNEKLDVFAKKYDNFDIYYDGDQNRKLLKRCAVHHRLLARVLKEVGEIFSVVCLVQLFCSVSSLCIICLAINTHTTTVSIPMVSVYASAHLSQLFAICFYGSDLGYEANLLPTHIYCSRWYEIENENLKKDVLFIMTRMQKEIKLSAAGIAEVGLLLFVNVLKFTFSVYTMLSKSQDITAQ